MEAGGGGEEGGKRYCYICAKKLGLEARTTVHQTIGGIGLRTGSESWFTRN